MQMLPNRFGTLASELRLQEQCGSYPTPGTQLLHQKWMIISSSGGARGGELKIPESKRGQLEPFYEAVYTQIKEFFAKRYVQAITGNEKQFGFITLI